MPRSYGNKQYNKAYTLAMDALNKKRYNEAQEYFNEAKKDRAFYDRATLGFICAELNKGNYSNTRKFLENCQEIDNGMYHTLYGDLDSNEFNFKSALRHYEEAFKDYRTCDQAILKKARTYVNLGEYKKALEIYKTYINDPAVHLNILLDKVYLNILFGNLEKAFKIFLSIPFERVKRSGLVLEYISLKVYLEHFCEEEVVLPKDLDPRLDYFVTMVLNYNRERLIEHIEKHKIDNGSGTTIFDKNVNIEKMLEELETRIIGLNPQHLYLSANQIVRTGEIVSTLGNETSDAVSVKTILRSNNILTAYPVFISEEFNKEGLLEDKALTLHRQQIPKQKHHKNPSNIKETQNENKTL